MSGLANILDDRAWVAKVVERLISKRRIADSGCWEWAGLLNTHGYGVIRLTGKAEWLERCHRLAYALFRGDVPDGAWVLHSCDNPRCFNPSHLFLGSAQENTDDMHSKGRWVRPAVRFGAENNKTKLTEANVLTIIERSRDGATRASLAKEFGVSIGAVSRIVLGKNWKRLSIGCGVQKSTRGWRRVNRVTAI